MAEETELLWGELGLGELLSSMPKFDKISLGKGQSSQALKQHKKLLSKPGYAVVMGRYASVPHKPTTIPKKKIDKLADPLRGRYLHYEKYGREETASHEATYNKSELQSPSSSRGSRYSMGSEYNRKQSCVDPANNYHSSLSPEKDHGGFFLTETGDNTNEDFLGGNNNRQGFEKARKPLSPGRSPRKRQGSAGVNKREIALSQAQQLLHDRKEEVERLQKLQVPILLSQHTTEQSSASSPTGRTIPQLLQRSNPRGPGLFKSRVAAPKPTPWQRQQQQRQQHSRVKQPPPGTMKHVANKVMPSVSSLPRRHKRPSSLAAASGAASEHPQASLVRNGVIIAGSQQRARVGLLSPGRSSAQPARGRSGAGVLDNKREPAGGTGVTCHSTANIGNGTKRGLKGGSSSGVSAIVSESSRDSGDRITKGVPIKPRVGSLKTSKRGAAMAAASNSTASGSSKLASKKAKKRKQKLRKIKGVVSNEGEADRHLATECKPTLAPLLRSKSTIDILDPVAESRARGRPELLQPLKKLDKGKGEGRKEGRDEITHHAKLPQFTSEGSSMENEKVSTSTACTPGTAGGAVIQQADLRNPPSLSNVLKWSSECHKSGGIRSAPGLLHRLPQPQSQSESTRSGAANPVSGGPVASRVNSGDSDKLQSKPALTRERDASRVSSGDPDKLQSIPALTREKDASEGQLLQVNSRQHQLSPLLPTSHHSYSAHLRGTCNGDSNGDINGEASCFSSGGGSTGGGEGRGGGGGVRPVDVVDSILSHLDSSKPIASKSTSSTCPEAGALARHAQKLGGYLQSAQSHLQQYRALAES